MAFETCKTCLPTSNGSVCNQLADMLKKYERFAAAAWFVAIAASALTGTVIPVREKNSTSP